MLTIKNKHLTFIYSFIQGLYWMNFAALLGYSAFYLLDSGFTNTEIGIIIAVAGIASAFLQPLIAGYADRPSSPSLKKLLQSLVALQFLLAIGLLFFKTVVLTGFIYGCSIALLQLITPFINSLGIESINHGQTLNYGLARGMGSVAYAALSYILGIVTSKFGALAVPVSITIITLLLIGVLVIFPFSKEETNSEANNILPTGKTSLLSFFIKYKRFSVVLLGCICIYIGHVLLNNFTFQIIEAKGGSTTEMGTATAIAAISELPALFLFSYIVKKIRCSTLFRITGIFFAIKSLGSLFAPNIPIFYGIQIFQMLGWGLMAASSVYYVNSIMEPEDVIKGQAYYTMAYTLGSVLASSLGGIIIDMAGINIMLLFAFISTAIGAVIVFIFASDHHL